MLWNCNMWSNWFTSHQSHYCVYYNGIPPFVRKCSILTVKIAQIRQNIWNFIVRKSNLQEMANFSDYPGDFRLQSGDLEKWFKIWSLQDYRGELTALPRRWRAKKNKREFKDIYSLGEKEVRHERQGRHLWVKRVEPGRTEWSAVVSTG